MEKLISDLQLEIQEIKKISSEGGEIPSEKLKYLLLASLMEEEENVSSKIKFRD